jgi:hypothetical protein
VALVAAAAIGGGAAAWAQETGPALGSVSNGKRGSTLKWMAPTAAQTDAGRTTAAQHLADRRSEPLAAGVPQPLPAAGANPINDPFGDRTARLQGSPRIPTLPPGEPSLGSGAPPGASVNGPGQDGPNVQMPGPTGQKIECPKPGDTKFFKKIGDCRVDLAIEDAGLRDECVLVRATYQARAWAPTDFMWTASGLCHKPLYFEEPHLERYGHTCSPVLRPIISAAHFFVIFPILPYKMGLEPPLECIYTLGYYRPGNCAPHMLDPIPLSVRAGLFEAGAWVGGAAIIP